MRFSRVTLMLSLPRSRSQWMAYAAGLHCTGWHDPLKWCESPADLVAMIDEWLQKNPGNRRLFIADTFALTVARYLMDNMMGLQVFKVVRPLEEVRQSLLRQGLSTPFVLRKMDTALHQVNVPRFEYSELSDEKIVRGLLTHIAGKQYSKIDVEALAMARIDLPVFEQVVFADRLLKLQTFGEL